jgi:hypothetical protein
MAQTTCEFCDETLKAHGPSPLRKKENSHRRDNHTAEMVPGIKFQRFAHSRNSFKLVSDWLTERIDIEDFLADEATRDHPAIRKMVEDKLDHAESFQPRQQLIERVDAHAIKATESHREWLRWVCDENTFGFDELVRLVRIWNTAGGECSLTAEDERDLNELVMRHI